MAPAYFLKIDGISGDSLEPEHVSELELQSFAWGESAEPRKLPTSVIMWAGSVVFAEKPEANRFRVLVEEHEFIAAGEAIVTGSRQLPRGRLIYAESFELDSALLSSD